MMSTFVQRTLSLVDSLACAGRLSFSAASRVSSSAKSFQLMSLSLLMGMTILGLIGQPSFAAEETAVADTSADEGAEAVAITHSFLATGQRTYIMEFAAGATEGETVWRYPVGSRDGWVLPNGNILLALNRGGQHQGGAAVEVTRENEIVWSYEGTQSEVGTVQMLENGNVLLTELGPNPRLLEVDRQGEIAVEIALQCQLQNHHMQTRMARKLPNGHYLAPHLHDFAVKEYDSEGEVVATFATDTRGREVQDWPFTAIRLENGNTLIGCTRGNRAIEVNPAGEIVWEVTNDDLPGEPLSDVCGVQRLPNGNTVMTSYMAERGSIKLIEVTPELEVVWSYTDNQRRGIHHFQILDTNGVPLPGRPLR